MNDTAPLLTPAQVKKIRLTLGWSVNEMADALCLSVAGGNTQVRRMEMDPSRSKAAEVSGPCAVAMMAFLTGFEPPLPEEWGRVIDDIASVGD